MYKEQQEYEDVQLRKLMKTTEKQRCESSLNAEKSQVHILKNFH